jgi:hypothetical protein
MNTESENRGSENSDWWHSSQFPRAGVEARCLPAFIRRLKFPPRGGGDGPSYTRKSVRPYFFAPPFFSSAFFFGLRFSLLDFI